MKTNELVGNIAVLQDMLNGATQEQWIALRAAMDALLQVKAFEDGERGKWIPVEDRLPEVHEVEEPSMFGGTMKYRISDPVLVTAKRERGLDDDPPVMVGFLEDDSFFKGSRLTWEDIDCNRLVHVTAWQPLPKPYGGAND